MSDHSRIRKLLAAALLSGGLTAGVVFFAGGPSAQTASPDPATPAAPPPAVAAPVPTGMMPVAQVPFYAEWASLTPCKRQVGSLQALGQGGRDPGRVRTLPFDAGLPGLSRRRRHDGRHGRPSGTDRHRHHVRRLATTQDSARSPRSSFRPGLKIDNQGADARCMTCHQGVESTASVNQAIANIADDTVEPKLAFLNVHYRAAGATLFGHQAQVAYEYPGKTYAGRFQHRAPYRPARPATTSTPSPSRSTIAPPATARSPTRRRCIASASALSTTTAMAMSTKASRRRSIICAASFSPPSPPTPRPSPASPSSTTSEAYPYFFIDPTATASPTRTRRRFPNRYNAWTPRLLKAAYNYQFVTKEPGAFAHNPPYTLQILYDSLADLGVKISIDLARAKRP